MRLTVFTDYALRVLMFLALEPKRRVRIREVAEGYGISHNHLMKVVNKLTRAELVEASRGVNGGLILARPAGDITVGEVVRKCEDEIALVECFREDNQCVITPDCVLAKVFAHALEEFLAILDQYTIADLVSPRTKLRKRLRISA
jgi:Rrf2 family nitric oxide-sensitive transcriptional repressor